MLRAGLLVGVVIAYLVATAACYQPELRDCTVQCSAATDCAGGQICRDDGWCARPELDKCPKDGAGGQGGGGNETGTDAAVGPSDSSTSLCAMGCTNGTCVAGVCVIDCSASGACQGDISCPANLPCRVVCGDGACNGKVQCGASTSCEVKCSGENSCDDEITCNANRCRVECAGVGSCKHRTKCKDACACDVTCSGAGSCAEAAECPATSCRLGNGCSSLLAGCDAC